MGVLKNIKIEIIILLIVTLNVFLSFNLDIGFYNYFQNYNKSLNSSDLKEFFINITELGNSFWYFGISIFGIVFFYINKKFKIIIITQTNRLINFFVHTSFFLFVCLFN